MIDLKKLRESAVYDSKSEFSTPIEPLILIELLDMLEEAQKFVAIVEWMEKQGRVSFERVREGHINGVIRWDIEYGYDGKEFRSKEGMRDAFMKAMKAKD